MSGANQQLMPGRDTQEWLGWLSENYNEKRGEKISHLVERWRNYDSAEADEWLSKQADGPLKEIAFP